MEADPYLLSPKTKGIESETPATADGMTEKFSWSFDWSYGAITKFLWLQLTLE